MKRELKVFKENHCFTKDEIKNDFQNFIRWNYIETDEKMSESYRNSMQHLFTKFIDVLENTHLPIISDDWWYYDYRVMNDGIKLTLNYCNELEIEDENEEHWGTTSRENLTLLYVKCDYLNVKEFADIHHVTDTTVRQWIRRGKLRTAKKIGRDWLIPSITEKPKRGFTNVSYYWNHLPKEIEKNFPFLKGYSALYIFQKEDDKTYYDCILGYPGQSDRTKVTLSTVEREKLEITLISADFLEEIEES